MRALVAVDLQGGASRTLVAARRWAERLGAVLDLLYVVPMEEEAGPLTDPELREMVLHGWDDVLVPYRAQLRMLLLKVPASMRGDALVRVGRPGRTIAAMGNAYDAVILTTHGRRGLERLARGSVAEKVVRTCDSPVLVLHPDLDHALLEVVEPASYP